MKGLYIVLGAFLFSLFSCATRDDVFYLQSQLQALEARQATAEKNIKSQGSSDMDLRNQSAGFSANLDNLRQEIRLLNGKIEEAQYQLQKGAGSAETLQKLMNQSRFQEQRIRNLEQFLNLSPPRETISGERPSSQSDSEPPSEPPPSASETQDPYSLAKAAFDKEDYETARQGFTRFLKANPASSQADNAQFWIGESYYREKWYEKAILEYQTVIEKYPRGNKIPAALFKQGLSFLALGDRSNGRLVLEELIQKYPKSNEAAAARKKLN